MIRKYILSTLMLMWSFNLYGIDFSGTYFGFSCGKKGCISDQQNSGILETLNFNLFPKKTGRVLVLINHNLEDNSVSLFYPEFDYFYNEMPLDGDEFVGNDDKSGNSDISGIFLEEALEFKITRYPGENNERTIYHKVTLTDYDKELRAKRKEIEQKIENISNLNEKINSLNDEIKNSKNEISKNNKDIEKLKLQLENSNKELKKTIKDYEIKITELNKENKKKINNLKNKHEKQTGDLSDKLIEEINKPLKIEPQFLDMRSNTNDECVLYTSPSKEASEIETLKEGTLVENLVIVGDKKDWSFVATEKGLIGYLITDCLSDYGGDDGEGPEGPQSDEEISISYPKWDKGQKNKRITLEAPGFISIKGNINIEAGILEIQLNNIAVDDVESNGNFEAFYIIKSGDNEMSLKVIDRNNEIHELNFIIATK